MSNMNCADPENRGQLTGEFDRRARTREIAAEFAARGDSLGWFEALYRESAGDLDLGFQVTAFDISPTALDWAKLLHGDTDIQFETADLFQPPQKWLGAFDFVLEVYTIQPLPLEMRPEVIDAVAAFVASRGKLVVVTCGREDSEEPTELPWALSRKDLSRFEVNGLTQTDFIEMAGDEDEKPVPRFVVEYKRL